MQLAKLFTPFIFLLLFSEIHGQVVSLQYRSVPGENISEFIHRETTYWSQVAQNAVDNDKMLAWELWQRVGGWDMDDQSSNFVFVNVFKDATALDNLNEIWSTVSDVLPNARVSDIETESLSQVRSSIFLRSRAGFGENGNYAVVNYSKIDNLDDFVEFETKQWLPFITDAINTGKTDCKGWSAATLLSPRGDALPFNVMTVDQFDKMSQALMPNFDDTLTLPDLVEYNKKLERKYIGIYRLVKRVD